MNDLPDNERPISEQFRIVAKQQVEADGAASLLEEMKTTTLERMKSRLIESEGSMPDNTATRLAKCSDDWVQYLREMVALRTKANLLKAQCEYLRMREREADRMGWYERTERKMGRSAT